MNQSRHNVIYDYSYKLFSNTDDNPKVVSLPQNVTPDALIASLATVKMDDVYKISVIRHKQVIDTRAKVKQIVSDNSKIINLFIADYVKLASDVNKDLFNKFDRAFIDNKSKRFMNYFTDIKTMPNNPVIITRYKNVSRNAVQGGGCVLVAKNVREWRNPKEYEWTEKHVFTYMLTWGEDILVNKKLQQIWPKETGKMPTVLLDMLKQNER